MPGTGIERFLMVVGVVAVAALAFLTFRAWRDYRDTAPEAARAVATPPSTTASVAGAEFDGMPRRTVPTEPEPAAEPPRLVLTAARGDSWVAVRAGSESGASLYEGTMTQGERISYRRKRLWIRFGLPDAVDATVDGDPAEIPDGVLTVLFRNGRLINGG